MRKWSNVYTCHIQGLGKHTLQLLTKPNFSRGNLSNKTLNNMSVSPNIGLLNLASTACLLSFTLLFFPPVLKSVFHWFKHFQILWIRKVYVCVIAARHLLHCCILFQIKLWAQSSNALIVLYFQSCSVTASFGISLSYMPLKIKGYALKFRQTGPCLLFWVFLPQPNQCFKCENSVVGLKIADLNSADLL